MTKKWYFSMESETGGNIEFTTADTASTGTSYLITAASGNINGKTIVGLVTASTSLYGRTVQNYVKDNNPYSIGLIDSTGAKYFFTNTGGLYILAPSSDIGTWQQYDRHSYQVFTETAPTPTPTPTTSGPTEGADTLTGTSGNDTINALGGNDKIDGGAGNDTINAGSGDDNITLSAGADTLDGGDGTDTLTLSKDITSYTISYNPSTLTFSIKDGNDTSTFKNVEKIVANSVSYNLIKAANSSASTLTGTTGIDYLFGGAGDDSLTGGAGADHMAGGLGNDTYFVDNINDRIIENAEGGVDSVESSVSYTLPANVEDLSLTGTAAINGTGNDLDNYLDGNDGNNILDGKGGNNYFAGRKGNDTFLVSSGVNEIDAGDGVDTLKFVAVTKLEDWTFSFFGDASVLFSTVTNGLPLQAYVPNNGTVEMVSFTLSTGATTSYALKLGKEVTTVSLTGTAKSDLLISDNGNDKLDGGAGADLLIGGGGDDTYVVDNAGDIVLEMGDYSGVDLVQSSLAAYTLRAGVENLTVVGRGLNGTGNSVANILLGNANKNTLSGGDGDDTLNGAAGQDTLTGGAGKDTFKFSASTESATKTPDTITDFVSGTDKVDVSGIDANTSTTGDQAFTFIGSAAFGKVAGQLRFASNVLYGDTNGDGTADFQINMTGLSTLLATDIVL